MEKEFDKKKYGDYSLEEFFNTAISLAQWAQGYTKFVIPALSDMDKRQALLVIGLATKAFIDTNLGLKDLLNKESEAMLKEMDEEGRKAREKTIEEFCRNIGLKREQS